MKCDPLRHGDDCPVEASVSLQVTGSVALEHYCTAHAQQRRQALDSSLVPYTSTSIVHTEPKDSDKLNKAYGDLQEQHAELVGMRAAVARLERMWNEADQAQQAFRIRAERAEDQAHTLAQENARLLGELAAANDRLEALEVEGLSGVDADADSDGPPSKVEGGEHAAKS